MLALPLKQVKKESGKVLVTVLVKAQQEDVFQLFYTTAIEENFNPKNTVSRKVKASNDFQQLIFEAPSKMALRNIRLDLGQNREQKSVEVTSISIKTDVGEHVFRQPLSAYFQFNEYVSVGDSGAFVLTEVDGKYDPFIYAKDLSAHLASIGSSNISALSAYLLAALISVAVCLLIFFGLELNTWNDYFQLAFILGFFAVLLFPILGMNFDISPKIESNEKRKKAVKPEFELTQQYFERFERYFNDNFGFREVLIAVGNELKFFKFQSSPHPDRALQGREGWLFHNNDVAYENYSHNDLLSRNELFTLVSDLEMRQNRLKNQGIEYFYTYWPGKYTIYPEYLPETMQMQVKDTFSLMDQLIRFVKETNSPLRIIDVKDRLLAEKKKNQLYQKFDTHWNACGAFVAYQAFFDSTFDVLGVKPLSIDDYEVIWKESDKGDLIDQLGIVNKASFVDKHPTLKLAVKTPGFRYLDEKGFPERTKITHCKFCKDGRKVLIFRDSYVSLFLPFLSLHFKDVVYIWTAYDQEIVDRVKPDIIIDAAVERLRLVKKEEEEKVQ